MVRATLVHNTPSSSVISSACRDAVATRTPALALPRVSAGAVRWTSRVATRRSGRPHIAAADAWLTTACCPRASTAARMRDR